MQTLMSRYRTGRVAIRIGAANAEHVIDVSALVRARKGNARLYWSLEDLYDLLDLSQYMYASKWITVTFETWNKWISQAFGFDDDSGIIHNMNHAENERATKKMVLVGRRGASRTLRCLRAAGSTSYCGLVGVQHPKAASRIHDNDKLRSTPQRQC